MVNAPHTAATRHRYASRMGLEGADPQPLVCIGVRVLKLDIDHRRFAVQLVGGPMLPMDFHGERLGACTDCRRYWGHYRAEEIDSAAYIGLVDDHECGTKAHREALKEAFALG